MKAFLKELMIAPIVNIVLDYASPDYRGQYNHCMAEIHRYGVALNVDMLYFNCINKPCHNLWDVDRQMDFWDDDSSAPKTWRWEYDDVVQQLDIKFSDIY